MSNIIKFVTRPLVDGGAFAQPPCRIAWLAPAIAATVATIGEGVNMYQQNRANNANMEIARYNAQAQRVQNEQNYVYNQRLMQQSNDFTEYMWNKANDFNVAYNEPRAVVDRLRNAGINPAAYFGTPYAANASSVQGAQASFQGVAPQMDYRHEYYPVNTAGMQNAANAFFQNQLLNEQSKSVGVDTQIKKVELMFKSQQEMADLQNKLQDLSNKRQSEKVGSKQYDLLSEQIENTKWQLRLFKDTYDDLRKREKLQNDVLNATGSKLLSEQNLNQIRQRYESMVAAYYPETVRAELQLKSAQVSSLAEQAALLVQQQNLTSKEAVAKWLDNQLKAVVLKDEKVKHAIRNGENKATKTLYFFADYLSSLLFGNLKLFK